MPSFKPSRAAPLLMDGLSGCIFHLAPSKVQVVNLLPRVFLFIFLAMLATIYNGDEC